MSQPAVSYAVQSGRITAHTDPQTGERYIIAEEADAEWMSNTDAAKQAGSESIKLRKASPSNASQPGSDQFPEPADEEDDETAAGGVEVAPGVPKLAVSKAKLEHFKALEREVDYLERIGKLVDAEAVKRAAFEKGRALQESIMALPDRLMGELAGETDPARVHALLKRELTRALQAVTGGVDQPEEKTA